MAYIASLPRRSMRSALVSLAVAAVVWIPTPATADPADLLLSEYVEGTGNNRALEMYNGTGAPVNLAAGGYNVQIYTDGRTSPRLTLFLFGTVASHDVFVLASAFADPALLARADLTSTIMPFTGNDAVLLRKGAQVIDSIGQVGLDPGTEWGAGLASTMDNTLRRKSGVETGDRDPGDAFDPAAEWEGYPNDTFDGLGWHSLCESNPPAVSVVVAPGRLWPPNHKLVTVNALVTAYDDTDPTPEVALVSVTSNEPDDGPGGQDGTTTDDVLVLDRYSFGLRAERSATGGGRVYTATYKATDACGNTAEAWAIVTVPVAALS